MAECNLLHIGLAKCASTYLQNVVFPSHPAIRMVPGKEIRPILGRLIAGDFSYSPQEDADRIRQLVAGYSDTGKRVVISQEGLSGDPYCGAGSRANLEELHRLFPSTHVMVVLRQQWDYVGSAWSHYVKMGGTAGLCSFVHSAGRSRTPWGATIVSRLEYDTLVDGMRRMWGADRCHVLFYEDLRRKHADFVHQVYQAASVHPTVLPPNQRVNKGLGVRSLHVLRFVNAFCKTPLNTAPAPVLPLWVSTSMRHLLLRLPAGWRPLRRSHSSIKRCFSNDDQRRVMASNRRLQEMVARDLTTIGYDA